MRVGHDSELPGFVRTRSVRTVMARAWLSLTKVTDIDASYPAAPGNDWTRRVCADVRRVGGMWTRGDHWVDALKHGATGRSDSAHGNAERPLEECVDAARHAR
jgi:hypothetical protein